MPDPKDDKDNDDTSTGTELTTDDIDDLTGPEL